MIRVINPFDNEFTILEIKKHYRFNLVKDLLSANLSQGEFEKILKDLYLDINALPIKGKKISAENCISVYKMRYKDENRNIGASGAYRLLCMVDRNVALPFHL